MAKFAVAHTGLKQERGAGMHFKEKYRTFEVFYLSTVALIVAGASVFGLTTLHDTVVVWGGGRMWLAFWGLVVVGVYASLRAVLQASYAIIVWDLSQRYITLFTSKRTARLLNKLSGDLSDVRIEDVTEEGSKKPRFKIIELIAGEPEREFLVYSGGFEDLRDSRLGWRDLFYLMRVFSALDAPRRLEEATRRRSGRAYRAAAKQRRVEERAEEEVPEETNSGELPKIFR